MKIKIMRRRACLYMFLVTLFLSVVSNDLYAQSRTITGVVSEKSTGNTLPGVNVVIKGTTNGTITDFDGKYSVQAQSGDVLLFSFIGFAPTEVIVGEQSTINIALDQDVVALEEVVAIGYGTQRKKDLTSAIGSVSSDDFKSQPITEAAQILQGRSAGVVVTKASGAPGGQTRIRVRGANSITGNNDPLYVIDGLVGADFSTLNPNDIEDMQILKDASATAIYGSRGANGVVIITTKGGKRGDADISFRATYQLSEVIKKWDLLSAGDFAKTSNEYSAVKETGSLFTDADIQGFYDNGGTDWQDLILRTAQGQEYQLTVSGGSDKSTYYISANYLDQEGIVINSSFKRYGLRVNVTSNITDKLKANIRTNFSHREAFNNAGGGGFRNPLNQMLAWAPTTPAYDEFGNINPQDNVGSTFESPLELATNKSLAINNIFTANANLVYTFFPGLSLDVGLGIRYNAGASKNYTQGLLQGLTSPDAAGASRGGSESNYLANTNILTYKKLFNNDHDLTVTAVNEWTKEVYDNFGVTANGLLFPVFEYNNLSLLTEGGGLTGQAYYGERRILSFLGRASYVYKGKYHLSASSRWDGASVFPTNHWSDFQSVSAGWTISEEDFFNKDFVNNLKVRASWGQTGNQGIGIYGGRGVLQTSNPRYVSTSFVNGELTTGLIMGNPGNTDLKWETTEQSNFGLDVAILNSRASLSVDYFTKKTSDLLIQMPIPGYAGGLANQRALGGFMYQNVGEVKNEGLELVLNADVIKTNDFTWSSNFNATFLNNEVVKLGREEFAQGNTGGTEGSEFIVKEGYSLGSFFGLNYQGLWQPGEEAEAAQYGAIPGDAKYKDVDGDFVIDSNDKEVIGSAIPKGTFGWNNTLTYKNFTLNIFFQALTGFDRWAFTYGEAVTPGRGSKYVVHSDILDRWDATTNPDSDIPAFSKSETTQLLTSRFVMDASFVRLKNLSLSYNLNLGGKKNLTLMLAGNNLLTFTKYKGLDPEAFTTNSNSDSQSGVDVGAYPNSKIYSLSATINF